MQQSSAPTSRFWGVAEDCCMLSILCLLVATVFGTVQLYILLKF